MTHAISRWEGLWGNWKGPDGEDVVQNTGEGGLLASGEKVGGCAEWTDEDADGWTDGHMDGNSHPLWRRWPKRENS